MPGERLADAPEVAALLQACAEVIQQRAADHAHFLDPERGLDGAADIPEVSLLRGDVPSGGEDVLVEQLGDSDGTNGRKSTAEVIKTQVGRAALEPPTGGLSAPTAPDRGLPRLF